MSGGHSIVLETLHRATSQEPSEFKPAVDRLESWQTQPGFYVTLVEIFSEHSMDVSVRWLAVTYFKNGVDMYWRKTAPKSIAEEEKTRIRELLLKNLREPVPQVAIQLAVLIAKLARVDCPKDWPDLLPTLFNGIKSGDDLVKLRTLLTLHHVVKQLASKRLAHDRRVFQELTSQMFMPLLELWQEQTNKFLNECDTFPCFERSHFCLKILRKLVIYGFKKPHENAQVAAFLESLCSRISSMLEFRKKYENQDGLRESSEKYIVLLTKIYSDLLENHPFSFLKFIKPCLQMTLHYVFTPAGEGLIFQRFIVQCCNLAKGILVSPEYKVGKLSAHLEVSPDTLEAHKLRNEFFTQSVLVGICNKLITCYFPLTSEELKLWETDPEGFSVEIEGSETWKCSLRPCIESLFVALVHEYWMEITPTLMEMVNACRMTSPTDDFHTICQKDAVYNALGLCANDLFDNVDFDDLFASTLVNELKVKGSNYRIIRRRAIWLVGKWIGVKMSPFHYAALYDASTHLLSTSEDFVVRVNAASTLIQAFDSFEFDEQHFLPYLPPLFELLLQLLKDANECDTKMQVLRVITFMFQRLGDKILPHIEPLMHYFPILWQEASDHNMLQCAIVTNLVFLVQDLKHESERAHHLLLPILRNALDPSHPSHVYLLEDGLDLWLTVVQTCKNPLDQLLDMYQFMVPLMENSSENLPVCLEITNAYIVFFRQSFLAKYGSALVECLRSLLTDLKSDGVVLVLKTVEMAVRVCPGEAIQLTGTLFASVLKTLVGEKLYPMMFSTHLSLVARVSLVSEQSFTFAISKVAEESGSTAESTLLKLLSVWCEKLRLVMPEEKRKLCALGLAHLCSKNWPPIRQCWGSAITVIAEVIFDITVEDSTDDKLVVGFENYEEDYEYNCEHYRRLRALSVVDPVHSVPLRNFVAQKLKEFEQSVGSDVVTGLFQTLEVDCQKLLQEILAQ